MKELSSNVTSLVNLKQAMPVLSPFLKEFGVEVDKMEDALQGIDGITRQTSKFISIPDRYLANLEQTANLKVKYSISGD
ncbi:hypothetical protein M3223_11120 [Paenibacillus pasadenensis]|uniref:hypothetical protein n=1 Tax=Paenibacillus pasadenensis TaxID=217090 RepID=UPI00203B9939|nr:hypothetical protein [Paenibacillus pasadenensis]MCM3747903.1 hypothetical protein [Paenibacillus pasadenensis]